MTQILSPRAPDTAYGIPAKTMKAMRHAAENFESMFVTEMMGHMFNTVSTDGPFGGGHAEKVFRSMMVDEYGRTIAKHQSFGIADQMMKHMIDLQSRAAPTGQ